MDDNAADDWYAVPYHYRSINEALLSISAGDVIRVHEGTYNESVRVDKGVTITSYDAGGLGRFTTVVNGVSSYVFQIVAGDVMVSDLTITGADVGIEVASGAVEGVIVQGCIITGCHYGIDVHDSQQIVIDGCYISGNDPCGIRISNSFSARVTSCTISDNGQTSSSYGIQLVGGGENQIDGNQVAQNYQHGIFLQSTSDLTIDGNEVADNGGTGLTITNSIRTVMRDNEITGNSYDFSLTGNGDLDHYLQDIDGSNTVTGGPVVYLVSQEGASVPANAGYVALVDCRNITVSGLSLDHNGQGVLLAFSRDCVIRDTEMGHCLQGIRTDMTSNQALDSCLVHDFSSSGIYIGPSPDGWGGHLIENVTVRDSTSDNAVAMTVYRSTGTEIVGGSCYAVAQGLSIISSPDSVISNTTFLGVTSGDAINLYDSPGSALLNCVINDSYNAVSIDRSPDCSIIDCLMSNNSLGSGEGTGISIQYSDGATVKGNTIVQNRKGVMVDHSSMSVISGNLITDNIVFDGIEHRGGICLNSSSGCWIENNSILGNENGIEVSGPNCSGIWVMDNVIENSLRYDLYLHENVTWTNISRNVVVNSASSVFSFYLGPEVSLCTIWDNSITSRRNAIDLGVSNRWNVSLQEGMNIIGGASIGGNFYSNYTGDDLDQDGIGDTSFLIEGGNIDNLPLYQEHQSMIEVVITSPKPYVNSTTVHVEWSVVDDYSELARIELRVDSSDWVELGAVYSYDWPSLGSGPHLVEVRAWNELGFNNSDVQGFVIDLTAPSLLLHDPNGTGVALDAGIFVQSDEPLSYLNFTVNDGLTVHIYDVTLNDTEYELTLLLSPGTVYQISIWGLDLAGNHLDIFSWNFTTTEYVTVSGRVVDQDGVPIAQATIRVNGNTTVTGTDGLFEVTVRPGIYQLVIEAGEGQLEETVNITGDDLGTFVVDLSPKDDWRMLAWAGGGVALIIIALVAILVIRRRRAGN